MAEAAMMGTAKGVAMAVGRVAAVRAVAVRVRRGGGDGWRSQYTAYRCRPMLR